MWGRSSSLPGSGFRTELLLIARAGFIWIRLPSGERVFVMPASKSTVREGQTAAIQGVVLELPEGLRVKLNAADEPIYIYADRVTGR